MKSDERIGLVFSGGGGKGSYQIGVWRALREFGIEDRVDAVAGTSVGALNATLFSQGDLDLAEQLWCNLRRADVLPMTPASIVKVLAAASSRLVGLGFPASSVFLAALATRGFFSRDGLRELCRQNVDWDRIKSSATLISATAYGVPGLGVKHFSLRGESPERCVAKLLASSAIPFVFPPELIDGVKYVDGGLPFIGCNSPIEALPSQKFGMIIVVLLSRDDTFDPMKYKDTMVLPIFPREDQGGIFSGVLDFDGDNARRRIQQGYEDTVRVLEPVYSMGSAQLAYDKALGVFQKQQAEWAEIRKQWQRESERAAEVVENLLRTSESAEQSIREATNRIRGL